MPSCAIGPGSNEASSASVAEREVSQLCADREHPAPRTSVPASGHLVAALGGNQEMARELQPTASRRDWRLRQTNLGLRLVIGDRLKVGGALGRGLGCRQVDGKVFVPLDQDEDLDPPAELSSPTVPDGDDRGFLRKAHDRDVSSPIAHPSGPRDSDEAPEQVGAGPRDSAIGMAPPGSVGRVLGLTDGSSGLLVQDAAREANKRRLAGGKSSSGRSGHRQ